MEAVLISPYGRTNLGSAGVTVGRTPDNQLVVNDAQSSSHHAEIRPSGQTHTITDLGSTNGTFLNDQRLTPSVPYPLNPGDRIRIGNTMFTYEASGVPQYGSNPQWSDSGNAPTIQAAPPPFPNYDPNAQPNYNPQAYPQQSPTNYGSYGSPPQQSYPPAPGQMGYPNYGAPPAVPVQPAQPRRRSRLGLWIALLLILLLVIIAGVGAYVYVNRSTPTKTLQAYCDAIKKGDAQGAFDQLSTSAKSKTSVAQISQGLQAINSPLLGGIKDCTVSNVNENGSTATGKVTLTFGRGNPVDAPATLVNENGVWKITNSNTGPSS